MSYVRDLGHPEDCPVCNEARSRAAHPAGSAKRDWATFFSWVAAAAVALAISACVFVLCLFVIEQFT